MNNNTAPFISVIVVNYNYPNDTIECIDSLMKTAYKNFEMIIIDNGSTDNSVDVLKEVAYNKKIIFIANKENSGFAGGNNIGIKLAKGEYILLLNNDTVVEEHFLEKLAKSIKNHPYAGAIGPKIYYYDEPDKIWFAGGELDWKYGGKHIGLDEKDEKQHEDYKEVEYITGCALLMKREAIETVGMLDESFFMYYEDVDWCLRARRAGYKCVYVPEPVLWHKVGLAIRERGKKVTVRQLYFETRNKIISIRKNYSSIKYLIFLIKQILIFTPAYVTKLLLCGEYNLLYSYLNGVRDGLRGKTS